MEEKEQTRSPVWILVRKRMNQYLESVQWRFATAAKERDGHTGFNCVQCGWDYSIKVIQILITLQSKKMSTEEKIKKQLRMSCFPSKMYNTSKYYLI